MNNTGDDCIADVEIAVPISHQGNVWREHLRYT